MTQLSSLPIVMVQRGGPCEVPQCGTSALIQPPCGKWMVTHWTIANRRILDPLQLVSLRSGSTGLWWRRTTSAVITYDVVIWMKQMAVVLKSCPISTCHPSERQTKLIIKSFHFKSSKRRRKAEGKRHKGRRRRNAEEGSDWRPWLDLPEELLDLIIKSLGFLGLLRFASVCRQWRFYASRFRTEIARMRPPLVLLMSRHSKGMWFLHDLYDGRTCVQRIFDMSHKMVIGCTSGFLSIRDHINRKLHFVNPLTAQKDYTFTYPPLPFSSVILASASNAEIVVVAFHRYQKCLQLYRCNDAHWICFSVGEQYKIADLVLWHERPTILTDDGKILVFHLGSDPYFSVLNHMVPPMRLRNPQLVVTGGELLMAECIDPSDRYSYDFGDLEDGAFDNALRRHPFKFYRLHQNRWDEVDHLGDNAVFRSSCRTKALYRPNQWGGSSNSVYSIKYCLPRRVPDAIFRCCIYSLSGKVLDRCPITAGEREITFGKNTPLWYFPNISGNIDPIRLD
ncbi:F-box domain [Dillenia turbinata]|uniref:F-box domain n=1 Tax=Dillenia turbinata TaxID=194707 RepID=A0AAN8VEN4_9MAGN